MLERCNIGRVAVATGNGLNTNDCSHAMKTFFSDGVSGKEAAPVRGRMPGPLCGSLRGSRAHTAAMKREVSTTGTPSHQMALAITAAARQCSRLANQGKSTSEE